MSQSVASVLGLMLLSHFAAAQCVPKLPQKIVARVVSNLEKQPTKIVEPYTRQLPVNYGFRVWYRSMSW